MIDLKVFEDLLKKPKIRLHGKKLLYSCDMIIEANYKEDLLTFEATGEGRFGPKKSSIEISSSYRLASDLALIQTNFSLSGLNRSESYSIQDEKMVSTINGISSEMDLQKRRPVDFLLLLNCFIRDQEMRDNLFLPIGNKLRNVSIKPETLGSRLDLGGKISLVHSNGTLGVPKFKITLNSEIL